MKSVSTSFMKSVPTSFMQDIAASLQGLAKTTSHIVVRMSSMVPRTALPCVNRYGRQLGNTRLSGAVKLMTWAKKLKGCCATFLMQAANWEICEMKSLVASA
eukprot:4979993-Pleurochrysis_carterae.AAC.1